MTKQLRTAIEAVINKDKVSPEVRNLITAYKNHRDSMTLTMERVEFLEDRLEEGMNKRQAAKALVDHDHRLGRRTAETLVYTSFSGMYQNPRKKRRNSSEMKATIQQVKVADLSAEEDLL